MGQQHRQSVGRPEGQVIDRPAGGRSRRSGCGLDRGSRGWRGGSRLCRGAGLSGGILGGRGVELRLGELHSRVGVGGQDPRLVTARVVHGDVAPGVLGQAQGIGGQIRQGGRARQADLDDVLDPQASLAQRGQQDLLGLDPTHRGGELPGQELDQ